MSSERDLFANFDRMRQEMDRLFGDVFEGRQLTGVSGICFTPRIDVYYAHQPPTAVITAELAGIDRDSLELEIEGRQLIVSGIRRQVESAGYEYQQVEIEHGPFRRLVTLAADVLGEEAKATYRDGLLTIEIPLAHAQRAHMVPIEIVDQE